jgi:hypothetical protein
MTCKTLKVSYIERRAAHKTVKPFDILLLFSFFYSFMFHLFFVIKNKMTVHFISICTLYYIELNETV